MPQAYMLMSSCSCLLILWSLLWIAVKFYLSHRWILLANLITFKLRQNFRVDPCRRLRQTEIVNERLRWSRSGTTFASVQICMLWCLQTHRSSFKTATSRLNNFQDGRGAAAVGGTACTLSPKSRCTMKCPASSSKAPHALERPTRQCAVSARTNRTSNRLVKSQHPRAASHARAQCHAVTTSRPKSQLKLQLAAVHYKGMLWARAQAGRPTWLAGPPLSFGGGERRARRRCATTPKLRSQLQERPETVQEAAG